MMVEPKAGFLGAMSSRIDAAEEAIAELHEQRAQLATSLCFSLCNSRAGGEGAFMGLQSA